MAKGRSQRRSLESYALRGAKLTIKRINLSLLLFLFLPVEESGKNAGDTVLIKSSEPGKPYVAKIEKIEGYEGGGTKKASGDSQIKVYVQWYYRPEESIGGRRQFHGSKEVFLSDHRDVQSADTIEGKCTVHSFKTYTKLDAVGNEDYFCRFEYNSITGAFTPDRVAVYCKCEMPYNPDDLMVQCEGCNDWFHPACIDMNIEEAKRLDHFFCVSCLSEDQRSLQNPSAAPRQSDVKVDAKRRRR